MTTEWGEKAIEQVARALYEDLYPPRSAELMEKLQLGWEYCPVKDDYHKQARSAILAFTAVLKEPSEEMRKMVVLTMLRAMLTRADEEIR